jgi:hypothetical protein
MPFRRNSSPPSSVSACNLCAFKKLAEIAQEESHKTCWKEAKVLQIEPSTTYRKYKKSGHMALVENPISQPSFGISLIWTTFFPAEVRKLQLRPV